MPTLEPHQYRHVAESFGVDAERYDRTRPRYPDALIDRIVATSPGAHVLDVGCGTGIVARQLQAAGCEVLGVEPDARMAEHARERGLEVEVAKIEEWQSAGRTFDAITAGQCWHWVDPVNGAAKAAQVLRPGGLLAVFWNADQPPAELATAFAEIYRRLLPDSFPAQITNNDNPYAVMTGRAADGIRETGAFQAPDEWQFSWEREYTRDEWLDRVPTHGGMSSFPADTVAEVLVAMGEAIDAMGGRFTMRFNTVAVTALRN
ncbi:bifunctional 2-polyprenyl-6-hydroxyphenol methylase/3-demethylubiquinol 3-O-methyltransferase UbiG [Kibdelosporangium persicum]|uniref:Class I SAM-dependent methyltransferase n=1 Tax=Kibdelosporangium persicum TaxID=2698649 RepID=A0ABX2F3E7_9PSEU|nr:class I SAM-dependent methyltransferase [Kibdelosporangium persicum]NRN65718.1 Class I SAM-dependent methyltransferase [Kibdelosporangium persicum]